MRVRYYLISTCFKMRDNGHVEPQFFAMLFCVRKLNYFENLEGRQAVIAVVAC